MMTAAEQDLKELVSTIWGAMLDMEIRPVPGARSLGGADRHVVGTVELTGAWEGEVAVDCSAGLARRAAAVMFGLEPAAVSPVEVLDAMGELANITGGNLKALLPGPSRLSLPRVMEGPAAELRAGAGPVTARVAFECGGQSMVVTVQGAAAV